MDIKVSALAIAILAAAAPKSDTLWTARAPQAKPAARPAGDAARARELYRSLPLRFESLAAPGAPSSFVARGARYRVTVDAAEARLSGEGNLQLRLSLVGADAEARPEALEKFPGTTNYFVGSAPAHWRTGVASYARVRYRAVYPGIDLVYYGNQDRLEYDFIAAPGADPSAIDIAFAGSTDVRRDASGDLMIGAAGSSVRLKKPTVYQTLGGRRRDIPAEYVVSRRGHVHFQVGAYDRAAPLIIDPVILYSTFLGGNDADQANDVAVDGKGNAYIVGSTRSASFPEGSQAVQIGPGGNNTLNSPGGDVFVAKINTAASGPASLVYTTIIGGSGNDSGLGIAVDGVGNAFVTGQAGYGSDDFPTTPGAFQPGSITGRFFFPSAFVLKLSDDGATLLYSTLFSYPFDTNSLASRIAVDASGNAYIAGTFPVTASPFPTDFNDIQSDQQCADVAKFDSTGANLLFSVSVPACGDNLAVDSSGTITFAGSTVNAIFQQKRLSLFRLDQSGNPLTFDAAGHPAGIVIGAADDELVGLDVDAAGNTYVARDLFGSAGTSAIVTRLGASPYQSTLAFGIRGHGLAVDRSSGRAFLLGNDASTFDPIVKELNALDGTEKSSFTLPTIGSVAIAADGSGAAYVVGTAAASFPVSSDAFDSTCGTAAVPCDDTHPDAFLLKIGGVSAGLGVTFAGAPPLIAVGHQATFTAVVSNAGPQAATNVTIGLTIPAGSTLVSATLSNGGACANVPLVCAAGSLAVGSSVTATMIVMAQDGAQSLASTATVSAAEVDPDPSDNTKQASIGVIKPADIGLTLISDAAAIAPATAQDTVHVTGVVQNLGPFAASNVTFTENVPYLLQVVATASGVNPCQVIVGSGVTPSTTITCALGTLASGASATIVATLRAQVTNFVPLGAVSIDARAFNTPASTGTPETDPTQANNTASVSVNVVNTLPGNVVVHPQDPTNAASTDVTVSFTSVTPPGGVTTVATSGVGPAPPANFTFGNPPVYFDIHTSAGFVTATVCITGTMTASARLIHYDAAGTATDVTAATYPQLPNPNIAFGTICSIALSSLSPFGVAEPVAAAVPTLDDLVAQLRQAALARGIETSLEAKLLSAKAALAGGGDPVTTGACSALSAFTNEVTAQSGKHLPALDAARWIAAAAQIRTPLGCR